MPASRRLLRSAVAVALASSATGLAYAGAVAPARAASAYNGYCTSSSGVTVVVDFGPLGGGVAIRCSPVGGGATGLQALQAAGIPVQGTQRYGLAFVCRLYGRPSASTTLPGGYHEQCVNTPPASAYWSYSQARNGGSWSVSSAGVESSQVIPGGFEGWSFNEGSNATPRATPTRPVTRPSATTTTAPARPHRTTSTTQRQGPAPSRHSTATHTTRASSTAGSQPASSSGRSTAAASSRSAKSLSSSASAAAIGSTSGGAADAAGAAPVANSDNLIKNADKPSGINATTVVGGVVLAVLAIGGTAVAIIRRRGLE